MIILDTNVISESLRPAPEPRVTKWLDTQLIETLYLSTITIAELRFGIAALPDGKRKNTLHNSLENQILPLFSERILPFDITSSQHYGKLMATARSAGLAIATADGYIAAIALTNKMMVATRDVSPFEAAGVGVVNPWEDEY